MRDPKRHSSLYLTSGDALRMKITQLIRSVDDIKKLNKKHKNLQNHHIDEAKPLRVSS